MQIQGRISEIYVHRPQNTILVKLILSVPACNTNGRNSGMMGWVVLKHTCLDYLLTKTHTNISNCCREHIKQMVEISLNVVVKHITGKHSISHRTDAHAKFTCEISNFKRLFPQQCCSISIVAVNMTELTRKSVCSSIYK